MEQKSLSFQERYRSSKSFRIYVWVVALFVLGLIGNLIESFRSSESLRTEPAQVSNSSAPTSINRHQVYVVAEQFAKEHLGKADYGFGDDGFVDYGDGSYMVTGVADVPGQRIRWTVELKHQGGEWQYNDNWIEKGWVANQN